MPLAGFSRVRRIDITVIDITVEGAAMRRRIALVVMSLVAFVAAGCSSSKPSSSASSATTASGQAVPTTSAPAGTPFVVVSVSSPGGSGTVRDNSIAALNAQKAAVSVLNAKGGILGHPIKLEILDDGGNPTNGAGLLQQRLQSTPKPDAIIPGSTSSQGIAYVPIATAAGILTIGTPSDLSLDNPSKYPYEFQLSASANELNLTALGYAQQQGAKKVAVIAAKDALGDSTVAAAKAGATKLGLTLVAEQYANTDLDITAPLQRLRAANPDFLLLEGFGAPVGYVLDSRLKLGWTAIPTLCITSCTVTALVVTSLVGAPAEQNVKLWIPSVQVRKPNESTAISTFLAALKAQGPITTSITAYSFQYDALMLLAAAAQQAKSTDTPSMTHALENLVQPANPMWVDYAKYIYTAQDHSPQEVPASDYSATTPAHLIDGQIEASSTS